MKDLLFADEYSIELKYLVVSNSIFHSKFKQIKFFEYRMYYIIDLIYPKID